MAQAFLLGLPVLNSTVVFAAVTSIATIGWVVPGLLPCIHASPCAHWERVWICSAPPAVSAALESMPALNRFMGWQQACADHLAVSKACINFVEDV